jgi:AmmeMemoRadiSam system protein A
VTTLNAPERLQLLQLARLAIETRLKHHQALSPPEGVAGQLLEKRGCFVTLHKAGRLRGCIGTIEPITPLIDCVIQNAINAAFNDPRFPSLTIAELDEIDIEISVLTKPEILTYVDGSDLKKKLQPGVHGVILSQGKAHRATFLPQVWDQLPDPEQFLSHLCQKAYLDGSCWKDRQTTIETYQAEYFGEKDGR